MGLKGIFVNIGRGVYIVEFEFVFVLVEGRLGGVGFDVFENESYVFEELFVFDNVVILFYVGSDIVEICKVMVDLVIWNLEVYFLRILLLILVF